MESVGTWAPLTRLVVRSGGRDAIEREWRVVEAAKYLSRVGIDLVECARTRSIVSDFGNIERAMYGIAEPVLQHPSFASHLEDRANNAMVAMHTGVDLIRNSGRYYLIENNQGPSIYARRRALYDQPFDPWVEGMAKQALAMGFSRVVPIALRWEEFYLEEFRAAQTHFGLCFDPAISPVAWEGLPVRRIVGLPNPLEKDTLYVVHSGLWTSAIRFIDNKRLTSLWLGQAIDELLPDDTLLTLPPTHDALVFPLADNGPRWPNLIVKFANGAESQQVVAARFESEREARVALGLAPGSSPPPSLRRGWFGSLIERDQMIFQDFIPPELDERDRPQMIRVHMMVCPRGSEFWSAHLRVGHDPVPEQLPKGLLANGTAFVYNEAEYRLVPPEYEDELRVVADHLGQAMNFSLSKAFQTTLN